MANFSEEIVREVLSHADIVEVISAYLPLKSAGRSYRTLCPFHSEKTPSFIVSPEKQIYHCFGCGEGGNALSFLMKYERLTFPEAVRLLADRAGIRLPERRQGGGNRPATPKLDLYEANLLASQYYQEQLRSTGETHKALQYLRSRGIDGEAVERFRLGYAPTAWDSLLRHLTVKGKAVSLLEAAGLILPGRRAGVYVDRFRDRLMIPIMDTQERILGFGARSFADGENKYVNSPTSPIYNKGETLYGLNFAAKGIREGKEALIVEGYFDLISLHLFGWETAVSSSGTSLTSGQARLLRRHTDRAILLFDSDPAGVKASLRSIEVLVGEGFSLRVAMLPAGHDPDSLLQSDGRGEMERVLRQSRDWLEYIWGASDGEGGPREIGGEVERIRAVLPVLAKMKDRLARAKYLKRLAEKSGLGESLLLQETREMEKGRDVLPSPSACSPPGFPVEERQALEIALLIPERRDRWAQLLDPSELSDPRLQNLFSLILRYGEREEELKQLLCEEGDEDVRRLCTGAWARGELTMTGAEAAFADCVRRMKERKEKARKEELRRRIREAEEAGDAEGVFELIKRHPSVNKSRCEL